MCVGDGELRLGHAVLEGQVGVDGRVAALELHGTLRRSRRAQPGCHLYRAGGAVDARDDDDVVDVGLRDRVQHHRAVDPGERVEVECGARGAGEHAHRRRHVAGGHACGLQLVLDADGDDVLVVPLDPVGDLEREG